MAESNHECADIHTAAERLLWVDMKPGVGKHIAHLRVAALAAGLAN